MGVSCELEGCSASGLRSLRQLEVHAAFEHVPFHEMVFLCAQCDHKPHFTSPMQLLEHKARVHPASGATTSDIPAAVLGIRNKDNLPIEEALDAVSRTSEKKKRFQCNRCAYGTNHSAWLLQKHVIYEHLVDQLGHAHEHDPGLSVPRVDKPPRVQVKEEEMQYDQSDSQFAAEMDYGDDAAFAAIHDVPEATQFGEYPTPMEDAADPDYNPTNVSSSASSSKNKKPEKKKEDYGEAIPCRSNKGGQFRWQSRSL